MWDQPPFEARRSVASHWEAIGVVAADADAFGERLQGAYSSTTGGWEHPYGFTAIAEDPSGARLTIHVSPDGSFRCAKPGFAGRSSFSWQPQHVVPDGGCPLCDVVMADLVDDDGELFYPFALAIETIGHTRALIPFGETGEVAFAALCESGEVWADEDAYDAAQDAEDGDSETPGVHFASRSLIPVGTFSFEPGHQVSPHVHAHGVVESVERRTNELGGGEFWAVRLDTLGGVFDVCAATGSLDREQLLAPGAVLGGTFWLVGSPISLRQEPGPVPVAEPEPQSEPERSGRRGRFFRRGS